MTWRDAARLGRLSNLPTVWSNVLAGVALVDAPTADWRLLPLLLAMSLAYVAGMYLNDAFDADFDARERPQRPIPAGRVPRATVFAAGAAMLAASLVLLLAVGYLPQDGTGWRPAAAGAMLAAAILLYDLHHKANPLSPLLMGLCRALVYLAAGFVFARAAPLALVIGATLLLGHIVGLTALAKQESLGRLANLWPLLPLAAPLVYGLWLTLAAPSAWLFLTALAAVLAVAVGLAARRRPGDIGRAVVLLLAGISLLDALLIAGAGRPGLAAVAAAGFALTLALQRLVPGT